MVPQIGHPTALTMSTWPMFFERRGGIVSIEPRTPRRRSSP
jgi:hypothetical protein